MNLERAMKMSDRLGGHLVQGHVDATAEITAISGGDHSTVYELEIPGDIAEYMMEK